MDWFSGKDILGKFDWGTQHLNFMQKANPVLISVSGAQRKCPQTCHPWIQRTDARTCKIILSKNYLVLLTY